MNRQELELLSVDQIHAIYKNIELSYHHKTGKDKLINDLLAVTVKPVEAPRAGAAPSLDEKPHTATQELKPIKKVADVNYPTVEEVEEAIAPYVQRGIEVLVLNENEFHFRKGGREDSGNLKQSLRRIVDIAARLV